MSIILLLILLVHSIQRIENTVCKPPKMMHRAVSVQSSRAPSFPWVTTNYGMAQGITSWPSKLQGSHFGTRPAPGLSFIKTQKKKTSELVKDFIFSAVDEEGQTVQLFPISINRLNCRRGLVVSRSLSYAVKSNRNFGSKERLLD